LGQKKREITKEESISNRDLGGKKAPGAKVGDIIGMGGGGLHKTKRNPKKKPKSLGKKDTDTGPVGVISSVAFSTQCRENSAYLRTGEYKRLNRR